MLYEEKLKELRAILPQKQQDAIKEFKT
jgi:hypothetical protein